VENVTGLVRTIMKNVLTVAAQARFHAIHAMVQVKLDKWRSKLRNNFISQFLLLKKILITT
jgi:hypothetical protein